MLYRSFEADLYDTSWAFNISSVGIAQLPALFCQIAIGTAIPSFDLVFHVSSLWRHCWPQVRVAVSPHDEAISFVSPQHEAILQLVCLTTLIQRLCIWHTGTICSWYNSFCYISLYASSTLMRIPSWSLACGKFHRPLLLPTSHYLWHTMLTWCICCVILRTTISICYWPALCDLFPWWRSLSCWR